MTYKLTLRLHRTLVREVQATDNAAALKLAASLAADLLRPDECITLKAEPAESLALAFDTSATKQARLY